MLLQVPLACFRTVVSVTRVCSYILHGSCCRSCVSQLLARAAPVAYTNRVCAEGLHFSAFHLLSSKSSVLELGTQKTTFHWENGSGSSLSKYVCSLSQLGVVGDKVYTERREKRKSKSSYWATIIFSVAAVELRHFLQHAR